MIATGILANLLIAVGTLIGFWLVYLWKRNPAVVDVGWATGLTLIGLFHSLSGYSSAPGALLTGPLILLWGVRLGGYLFWTRIRLGKRDARYESLHQHPDKPAPLRVLIHYMIQACFQAVLGLALIFAAHSPVLDSMWTAAGLLLWFAGYTGSIAADVHLHRFRSNPDNHGKVCRDGLWNYSRHPNYFFEILLWTGFAIIGIPGQLGWIGLISPLTLLLVMARITGPISEQQSLKSKPDAYREYQATTSMIMPWFRKDRPASATPGSRSGT